MRRIGIFGGSFSPPHKGHIKSALAFYDKMALDELRILPAGMPPHKILEGDATPQNRYDMVKLAFDREKCGERNILIDDYEVKEEGKSYTYKTLEHFVRPNTELFLLVGTDMFLSLETWMHPEIIFSLCTVVVNRRENDFEEELFAEKKEFLEQSYQARILIPDFHPFVSSSSEVRTLLASGVNNYRLRSMLTPAVVDYIIDKDLYGYVDACLENIRTRLPEFMSQERRAHVLSVEKEIVSMARLAGLSPKETFILRKAALLHDITHEKSLNEQIDIYEKYHLKASEEDLKSPAVLHQFTGAVVAYNLFDLEKEGCDAISSHTTGKPEMSIGEMLLCLADYIERTRPYPSCKELRRYFYQKAQTGKVGKALLCDCMKKYLSQTIAHLKEKNACIHPLTLEAYEYYQQF